MSRRWFRVLTILCAGLAAHGGCLKAVFYLDDLWQIQDSEFVEGGRWWGEPSLMLTNLSYYLTWRLAGSSPVAFHAGNLMLHLLTSLSVYWLARYLLAVRDQSRTDDWETIAWIAALIFAVHPLNTEVTHYARARDHGLVGLWSFLAAGWMALALRRNRLWGIAALLAVLLAAVSKGPGLPHALLSVALVVLAFSTRAGWRVFFANRPVALITTGVTAGALWLVSGHLRFLFSSLVGGLTNEDFGPYALTQCRVLPQYLWRMVLPVNLCSDHLFESTKDLLDPWAWVCAAGLLGFIIALAFAWIRGWRPWALIIALGLGGLLLRWLYVVSEMMVEYRTYPTMPFVAMLLAGIICHWRRKQPRLGTAAVCVLLAGFGALAHRRSADWASRDALHAQILRLYPLQLRAMNCLAQDDLREGRYGAILERHPEFVSRLGKVLAFTGNDPHRGYQSWPWWFVCEECAVAEAIAHTSGPSIGRDYHNLTAWKMNEAQFEHGAFWAEWHLSAGKIASLAGDLKGALRELVQARQGYQSPIAIDREIRKILPAY